VFYVGAAPRVYIEDPRRLRERNELREYLEVAERN
jgi:hypothetical protein